MFLKKCFNTYNYNFPQTWRSLIYSVTWTRVARGWKWSFLDFNRRRQKERAILYGITILDQDPCSAGYIQGILFYSILVLCFRRVRQRRRRESKPTCVLGRTRISDLPQMRVTTDMTTARNFWVLKRWVKYICAQRVVVIKILWFHWSEFILFIQVQHSNNFSLYSMWSSNYYSAKTPAYFSYI